jgi:small subunit ribosomal protein S20
MPNSPSAAKRLRQSKIRQQQNKSVKSAIRTQLKKVRTAATAGQIDVAEAEFKIAAKRLDRAGAHRVIHPNLASRQKSRLQRMIRKAKSGASS